MTKLSSTPYKGTRDWYPEDARVRAYIFSTWKRVLQRFGYEAYDAPLLEPIEVYAAKSGEEIVSEQTYRFVDRGNREVAIRPEMTPSVSRMIAARRQEVAYPARWYNIGQFMRYERPQKGREREFWQLNVDIFGVDDVRADAEILTLANALMDEFGAKASMYTIAVNNRKVIDFIMRDYFGLDTIQSHLMIKLFDRKNKISHEAFRDQAIDIFGEERAPQGLQKIAALLRANTIEELPDDVRFAPAFTAVNDLFAELKRRKIKATYDVTLMRGLDYYTGMVFEVYDTHPENNRSLFGGGRYDGLVGLFGAEPVSAVGMAPGLTMMEIFLKTHELLPKLMSTTDVYVVVFPGAEDGARDLAVKLRDEGLNVELDITGRKADKQLKTAVKKAIPHIVFVGEDELESEVYPCKDVETGKEEKLSFERIVTTIHDHRRQARASDDDLLDI